MTSRDRFGAFSDFSPLLRPSVGPGRGLEFGGLVEVLLRLSVDLSPLLSLSPEILTSRTGIGAFLGVVMLGNAMV